MSQIAPPAGWEGQTAGGPETGKLRRMTSSELEEWPSSVPPIPAVGGIGAGGDDDELRARATEDVLR